MKPSVKSSIAIFYPQGFLDSTQVSNLFSLADIKYVENLNVKGIFVSLSKVIFFNKKGIENLIGTLQKFRKDKKDIAIGFCDYDKNIYYTLLNMFDKDLNINLFKDQQTLSLFIGEIQLQDRSNILVWNDDSTQKSTMLVKLYERGITAHASSSKEEYLDDKKSGKYSFIVDNCFLSNFASGFSSQKVGNVIIYKFDGFVDAKTIDSFDFMYHQHSLNIGFKYFVFDFEKVLSVNVHGVSFLNKITMAAAEYNATVAIANMNKNSTGKKLIEDMEDSGILMYDTLDDFLKSIDEDGFDTSSGMVMSKHKKNITKDLVENLPIFINACVHSLNVLTNSNAVKKSIEIQELSIDKNIDELSLIASSIGFYGDLDGMAILVFTRQTAKKVCNLFIGEDVDDDFDLSDPMQEFVNIIGGQAKSMLSDNGIKINITLPNIFDSLNQLLNTIKDRKGVEVVLEFNSEPFYFYLTK